MVRTPVLHTGYVDSISALPTIFSVGFESWSLENSWRNTSLGGRVGNGSGACQATEVRCVEGSRIQPEKAVVANGTLKPFRFKVQI